MIPVFQTKFGHQGSCFTACIASILEISLNDLPNFVEYNEKWILKLWDFLEPKGLTYTSVNWKANSPPERIPAGYHLINGYAPRGFRHSVIGFRGVMIHDPFPRGNGLITVEDWGVIHPLDQDDWEKYTIPFEAKT